MPGDDELPRALTAMIVLNNELRRDIGQAPDCVQPPFTIPHRELIYARADGLVREWPHRRLCKGMQEPLHRRFAADAAHLTIIHQEGDLSGAIDKHTLLTVRDLELHSMVGSRVHQQDPRFGQNLKQPCESCEFLCNPRGDVGISQPIEQRGHRPKHIEDSRVRASSIDVIGKLPEAPQQVDLATLRRRAAAIRLAVHADVGVLEGGLIRRSGRVCCDESEGIEVFEETGHGPDVLHCFVEWDLRLAQARKACVQVPRPSSIFLSAAVA
mmetsp:Transcript_34400/g.87008  ORF Transcript_34400/g.87008 Transcript_34400/m.87008 type:complete len:269 (+) Transcript_34400:1132-1938(+)